MRFEIDTPYDYLPLLVTGVTLALTFLALPISRSWAWKSMLIALPWSAEIAWIGEGTQLSLPSDAFALLLGSMALAQLLFVQPQRLRLLWQEHTLFRWIGLYFLWMGFIAVTFSVEKTFSIKFLLSQGAYFCAFGLLSYLWVKANRTETPLYIYRTLLLPSAGIVLTLLVYRHLELGAKSDVFRHILPPLMREHTVYGAYAAWFFTAAVLLFAYRPSGWGAVAVGITGAALILSYSRGAWLSALGALGVFGGLSLLRRLSPAGRWLLAMLGTIGLLSVLLFLMEYNPDVLQLQARRTGGEISERLVSSFDVQRNLSNLERVNRWYAALQMIQERPFHGFGPNTFAQEYSAYQSSLTRTHVSVEMGEVGGAHSEYFTAASELGIPGLIFLLGIYITTLSLGIRGFWKNPNPTRRWAYAVITFPLLSYYLHGFINNFMDHSHISALVYLHWGLFFLLEEKPVPSTHTHTSSYA